MKLANYYDSAVSLANDMLKQGVTEAEAIIEAERFGYGPDEILPKIIKGTKDGDTYRKTKAGSKRPRTARQSVAKKTIIITKPVPEKRATLPTARNILPEGTKLPAIDKVLLLLNGALDGATQKEICAALSISRPTVSKVLRELETTGAVEKKWGKPIIILPAGREMATKIKAASPSTKQSSPKPSPSKTTEELLIELARSSEGYLTLYTAAPELKLSSDTLRDELAASKRFRLNRVTDSVPEYKLLQSRQDPAYEKISDLGYKLLEISRRCKNGISFKEALERVDAGLDEITLQFQLLSEAGLLGRERNRYHTTRKGHDLEFTHEPYTEAPVKEPPKPAVASKKEVDSPGLSQLREYMMKRPGTGLPLKRIMHDTGLSKSPLQTYLGTLQERGDVKQSGRGNFSYVGPLPEQAKKTPKKKIEKPPKETASKHTPPVVDEISEPPSNKKLDETDYEILNTLRLSDNSLEVLNGINSNTPLGRRCARLDKMGYLEKAPESGDGNSVTPAAEPDWKSRLPDAVQVVTLKKRQETPQAPEPIIKSYKPTEADGKVLGLFKDDKLTRRGAIMYARTLGMSPADLLASLNNLAGGGMLNESSGTYGTSAAGQEYIANRPTEAKPSIKATSPEPASPEPEQAPYIEHKATNSKPPQDAAVDEPQYTGPLAEPKPDPEQTYKGLDEREILPKEEAFITIVEAYGGAVTKAILTTNGFGGAYLDKYVADGLAMISSMHPYKSELTDRARAVKAWHAEQKEKALVS